MSKKQLHSRLENLFSDLAGVDENLPTNQQPADESTFSDTGAELSIPTGYLSGWTWEISPDHTYTSCGSEVIQCLGISAGYFQGQSFLNYAIHPKSSALLQIIFEQKNFPAEVDVLFKNASGGWSPVRLNILQKYDSEGIPCGWQGFAQLLPEGSLTIETPPLPAPDPVVTPPTSDPWTVEQSSIDIPVQPSGTTTGKTPVGIAYDQGVLHPATQVWTPTGQKSLKQNEFTYNHAQDNLPATLAVPFQMQGVGNLLLEIVDDSHQRQWTEDERSLVIEVTAQLALALDNAQLYMSAQQELAERIRAEQTILRRNKDLATLNRIGQQLSHLATRAEIFDLLSTMIGEVLNSANLYICSYDSDHQMLSFPVYIEDGKQIYQPERPFGNGIPEYVIRTQSPLLVANNVSTILTRYGIELPERLPASLLAIPMIVGERTVGVIVAQDFEQENVFDAIHVELLSTAGAQASIALENADLFQQMQTALETLETRERYQANVARAVASLTEFGTKSLPDVLKILGQAAQCSRIYFAQVNEDQRGSYWTSVAEWIDPSVAYLFDKSRTQHMPVSNFPTWAQDLREKGWKAALLSEMEAQSPEAEFLASQRINSTLLLAVQSKGSTPSFIAFDQLGNNRIWHNEEINSLHVAADAIANTFVREDLLEQVQVSLDETESLYKASNRLALANDMQEMVAAVLSGFRSPEITRAVLLLFEYDNYNKISRFTVGANWYSGRGTPPPPVGTEYFDARFERIFTNPHPVFYDDVAEADFDMELREILLQQNTRSLGILPLWTGKRQTGVFLLQAESKHRFTGRETRTYPPLADQMAIAVENQRLFEQTQNTLAETELLYNVSNRVAQANDTEDMLALIVESVLPAGADRTSIILTDYNDESELVGLEVVGFYDIANEYKRVGVRIPVSMLPIIRAVTDEPLIISDVDTYPLDPDSRQTLKRFNIQATCIVPLRTSGRLIGVLTASSRQPTEFDPDDTRLLRVVGNGIAVALEKQRLLREAQRRALELQTASEIARDTTSTLSLDLLLSRIVDLLSERFNFSHTSIYLLDETGTSAVVRQATGAAGEEMEKQGYRLAVGSKTAVGTVTETGEPFIIPDVQNDVNFHRNPLLPETRSEMSVPLKISNKVIGALDLHSKEINAFNQDDVTVLQILADQIAIAIENARAYELSQKAIEDMKEVDRVKSQFLANMSHELRTPLNSIIGFSRVILKGIDGPINEIQKQDMTAIYNSGQHLLTLINDILDLSRIEAGKMELAFAEVNVIDLVNSVMSTAVGLVKDKPIKLVTNLAENLPTVRADSTRVRQVLINFLSNAAKFTEEGTITVEASLIMSPTNKPEVMISVTDTGPGIAAQDQAKLFLPFSQVDDSPTRKTGGTGLGLSICRSLIDMHNGRIGLLWSEVGKGSTFFFTLPPILPETEPEPADNNGIVILTIDDDPKIISLYDRYLKPHGYQVFPLTNPREAVQRAKEIQPFAITLDVMMPEKDGWQVMRELKNDPDTRDIPIVVCSILESQEKGFSLGAADYLVKPFLQEDLINSINRLNRDGQIKNILVIDDDPGDLRLVEKMLDENQKYRLTLAQGGKQGWESIQANHPDAIILDLFMPDMNGFTILENLRAEPDLRAIPVIILTGADLTAEQHQQLAEFGQNLLAKGYLREKELLVVLEEALRKYRLPAAEK